MSQNDTFEREFGQDAVLDAFEHLNPVVWHCCTAGWEIHRNRRLRDPRLDRFRLRTHRCCVNDEILQLLQECLDEAEDIEFVEEHESTVLVYRGRYRCRVKKIDRLGRTSNVPTGRQREIRGQFLLPFPGLLPDQCVETWITIGYEPDELEQTLKRIAIGVESVGGYAWSFNIPEPEKQAFRLRYPLAAEALAQARRQIA